MTYIIIDDEWASISDLAHMANRSQLTQLGIYTDPMEGLAMVRKLRPDVVFCDVRMPGIDGFTLASEVEKIGIIVVLVTAYEENAKEGTREDVSMLMKPVNEIDFVRSIGRCAKRLQEQMLLQSVTYQQSRFLNIPKLNERSYFEIVSTTEIVYIEIIKHTLKLYLVGENTRFLETYNNLSQENDYRAEYGFVRIHRSYIVNMSHVKSLISGKIALKDRENTLPIGRTYRKKFMVMLKK